MLRDHSHVENLGMRKEYQLYASPLHPTYTGPALVIEFPTTIAAGLNYFGKTTNTPNFASDSYATKFLTVQVELPGLPDGLIDPANVYLLPVGSDIMRVPGHPEELRAWKVLDQTLPAPSGLGVGDYQAADWMPWATWAEGPDAVLNRRLQPSFGAADPAVGNGPDVSSSLVGRSVWNDQWALIIPGVSLTNTNYEAGLDTFINEVDDIVVVINAVRYNVTTQFNEGPSDGRATGGEVDKANHPTE